MSVNERSTIISLTKEKTEKKKKKISETTRLVEKFKAIPSRIGKQISDSQLCELTFPVGGKKSKQLILFHQQPLTIIH